MRHVFSRIVLGFLIPSLLTGCLKDASITSMGSAFLSGPTFLGQTTALTEISSSNQAVAISGECSASMSNLSISFDAGASWLDFASAASLATFDSDCSDESFSFSISDISTQFNFSSVGQKEFIYVRADMLGFTTSSSIVTLEYVVPVAPPAPSGLSLVSPLVIPSNNPTPTIRVAGVTAGHTVTLYLDSVCTIVVNSAVVAAGTSVDIVTPALSEGVSTIYATATNALALESTCSSANVAYTLDTTAPSAPSGLSLSVPASSPASDTTPTIMVSGVNSGDSVSLFSDASCTTQKGSATAAGATVLITPASSIGSDAVYTFYAKATDPVGNASGCSTANVAYTLDTTAPSAPSGLSLNTPATSPANDSTPTIMVSGVNSGDTVALFSDASCTTQKGSATAAGPTVLITPASSIGSDAVYTFYAKATDSVGNASNCSSANVAYTLDATAPSAPSGLSLSVPATSPANDTTPTIMVSGVNSGDLVSLYSDASCATQKGSATAAGATVLITPASSIGSDAVYTFYAKATDPVGNASACSSANVAYTLDTTAPSAPSGLSLNAPATSPNNIASVTVRITGVNIGDTVTLHSNSSCTFAESSSVVTLAYVDISSATLSEGTHTFYAIATDPVGNISPCSSANVTYVLDSTPPAAPAILSLSSPAASPATDTTPEIQISGVNSGDSISLFSDASCSTQKGSATAAGPTVQITSSALGGDAVYTFYAKATDTAGNPSGCSTANITYTLDTTPPAAPSSLSMVSPNASIGNISTPTVRAIDVIAGDTVTLYTNSNCTISDNSGPVTGSIADIVTTTLTPGSYTFYATSKDAAGNESACSSSGVNYTLDTTPPAAPTGLSLFAPVTSPSNVTTPTIEITGVTIGDRIDLYKEGSCVTSIGNINASSGSVQITPASSIGSDMTYNFYAKATDPAGNASGCSSATVAYTLDTVAPNKPSSLTLFAPSTSPSNDTTPTIQISTVNSGDKIEMYSDSSCTTSEGFVTAGASNAYITTSSLSTNGPYNFYAQATDPAGNTLGCSSANVTYTLDTIAPTVSVSPNTGTFNTNPVVLTFTFSEAVAGFAQSDITVSQGNLTNFTVTSATIYTVEWSSYYYGSMSVNVAAGVATDAAGNTNTAMSAATLNSTVPGVVSVVAVYPTNANWNDYVKNYGNGTNEFNRDDIACLGTETGTIDQCIHGGEKRRVIVHGWNSCANLTITDSRNAFQWICDDTSGTATFYMKGLQPNKGLRDLLSATPAFLNNSISVNYFATNIANSNPAVWWSNPVTALPNNSTDTLPGGVNGTLGSASTIYALNANRTTIGYNITADKVSVVTLSTFVLSHTAGTVDSCDYYAGTLPGAGPNIYAMFCLNNRKHLWLEVNMNGAGNMYKVGIDAVAMKFSRVHKTTMTNFGGSSGHSFNAIFLDAASDANQFTDIIVDGSGGGGLELANSNYNIFRNFKSAKSLKDASRANFYLDTSHSNRFYDISIDNDRAPLSGDYSEGIYFYNSNNNIISGIKTANFDSNASSDGIFIGPGSSGNIITKFITMSLDGKSLYVAGASNNIITHATFANSFWNGVYLGTESGGSLTNNYFNSLAIVNADIGIDTGTTSISGATNYFYNSAASNNYTAYAARNQTTINTMVTISGFLSTNGSCMGTPLGSNCQGLRVATGSLGPAFVGAVSTDTANATTGTKSFSSILNWFSFDNFYRGWGLNLSTFASAPGISHEGPCISGDTCQIGDWRIKLSSPLHNKSGNGLNVNDAFIAGSTCPSQINGNQVIATGTYTFLKSAIEITDDEIGNNNGLCESNEACIYAPNIGAYQGEGDYKAAGTCNFVNGTTGNVTNVSMYAYPVTGL